VWELVSPHSAVIITIQRYALLFVVLLQDTEITNHEIMY
jgi:hypothetical protein